MNAQLLPQTAGLEKIQSGCFLGRKGIWLLGNLLPSLRAAAIVLFDDTTF
jgi:hypothetical protein